MSTLPPNPLNPFARPPEPPRRSNGAAVASLVFGILGCIPEVTGMLAIIFGIVGLRRARRANTGGAALAGAGLGLGILSVLAWSLMLTLGGMIYVRSEPQRALARQYVLDLSQGNMKAVWQNSAPTVTRPEMDVLVRKIRAWGTVQDLAFKGAFVHTASGITEWRLAGRVTFSNRGPTDLTIVTTKQYGGWKVKSIIFR